ncbi:cyclic nucleotide-binding domain-containing protein, partial [bacterium]|nr:cyclic nucleotide-binding domain-containing protein [bacterium]
TDDESSTDDGQQYAPPTAQCARQQARYLAANIAASLSAKPLKSFAYQAKGSLASLGGYRGVAEVYGLALTGLPASLLWRALYIGMLPGLGTRIRVGLNWIYDYLMPRKVVNISQSEQTATRYLHYAAGDCAQHTDEKPAGFYVVVEGRLEQRVRQADGSMAIYELMPGDSWGSKALKEERLTLTEIIALEDSTVLLVDDEDFLRLRKVYKPLDKQLDAVGR